MKKIQIALGVLIIALTSNAHSWSLDEETLNNRNANSIIEENIQGDYAYIKKADYYGFDKKADCDGSDKKWKFSPTTKSIVVAAGVAVGVTAVWFYGPPLLYYTGYMLAEYMVPTSGLSYYLFGVPTYCNAGLACSTSSVSNIALSSAAGTLGGFIGNATVNVSETVMNSF